MQLGILNIVTLIHSDTEAREAENVLLKLQVVPARVINISRDLDWFLGFFLERFVGQLPRSSTLSLQFSWDSRLFSSALLCELGSVTMGKFLLRSEKVLEIKPCKVRKVKICKCNFGDSIDSKLRIQEEKIRHENAIQLIFKKKGRILCFLSFQEEITE